MGHATVCADEVSVQILPSWGQWGAGSTIVMTGLQIIRMFLIGSWGPIEVIEWQAV